MLCAHVQNDLQSIYLRVELLVVGFRYFQIYQVPTNCFVEYLYKYTFLSPPKVCKVLHCLTSLPNLDIVRSFNFYQNNECEMKALNLAWIFLNNSDVENHFTFLAINVPFTMKLFFVSFFKLFYYLFIWFIGAFYLIYRSFLHSLDAIFLVNFICGKHLPQMCSLCFHFKICILINWPVKL